MMNFYQSLLVTKTMVYEEGLITYSLNCDGRTVDIANDVKLNIESRERRL